MLIPFPESAERYYLAPHNEKEIIGKRTNAGEFRPLSKNDAGILCETIYSTDAIIGQYKIFSSRYSLLQQAVADAVVRRKKDGFQVAFRVPLDAVIVFAAAIADTLMHAFKAMLAIVPATELDLEFSAETLRAVGSLLAAPTAAIGVLVNPIKTQYRLESIGLCPAKPVTFEYKQTLVPIPVETLDLIRTQIRSKRLRASLKNGAISAYHLGRTILSKPLVVPKYLIGFAAGKFVSMSRRSFFASMLSISAVGWLPYLVYVILENPKTTIEFTSTVLLGPGAGTFLYGTIELKIAEGWAERRTAAWQIIAGAALVTLGIFLSNYASREDLDFSALPKYSTVAELKADINVHLHSLYSQAINMFQTASAIGA